MDVTTIGELLHWSYANLAMAHSAVTRKSNRYERIDYIIRSRLYKGLQGGTMKPGHLAEDERLKMILPQSCCYCGQSEYLAADHLIPRKKGGAHSGDNLVWACRSCNSSKHADDVLEWLKSGTCSRPFSC
jgi:5-methylcytosine-specific restriction endonuclease McrA